MTVGMISNQNRDDFGKIGWFVHLPGNWSRIIFEEHSGSRMFDPMDITDIEPFPELDEPVIPWVKMK